MNFIIDDLTEWANEIGDDTVVIAKLKKYMNFMVSKFIVLNILI